MVSLVGQLWILRLRVWKLGNVRGGQREGNGNGNENRREKRKKEGEETRTRTLSLNRESKTRYRSNTLIKNGEK